jgi:YebC/PmpR family DNA-binding regulatory protein
MSGHSKWHSIKHKKAGVDAKRGKIFTRAIKEIIIAARMGGGDPGGNSRLRLAIEKAKSVNMPKDNIERAIKKGTGDLQGSHYEEIMYEGYGPSGVAVLVEILTDNHNRTVSDIRHIFIKNNGKPGEAGSVSWLFSKKGVILVERGVVDEDLLMEVAIDAGAEDIREEESTIEIVMAASEFEKVKRVFDEKGFRYLSAEVSMVPQNVVKLEGKEAEQMIRLMELLEENADVQNVYANFDIPEEIIEQWSAS